MNINAVFEFLKDNILVVFIPALAVLFILLKPFRKFMAYCAKNTTALVLLAFICFTSSFFGYTISFNVFSVFSALLLGLPGISLSLFLSLVI